MVGSNNTTDNSKELPPYKEEQRVPPPVLVDGAFTSPLTHQTTSPRSMEKRKIKTAKISTFRLNKFLQNADKFYLPFSLEELHDVRDDIQTKILLKKECERLMDPRIPSRPFSGQYFDSNGNPILCYFGERVNGQEQKEINLVYEDKEKGIKNNFDVQMKDHSLEILNHIKHTLGEHEIFHDGISGDLLTSYHEHTQTYFSEVQPVVKGSEKRHTFKEISNPRVHRYIFDGNEVEERVGVYHLVHSWIQQRQPEKGLFLCSTYTKSGIALKAADGYYKLTQTVAETLSDMFKAVFPDVHEKYEKAFKAGVWFLDDPGVWLGRALIYKLQGEMHRDENDVGPTVSFPCGDYNGGEMIIPQIHGKFSYLPGHVFLFYSADIYHLVAPWKSPEKKTADRFTPGRIGSVFFFPEQSFEILKDKPEGWFKNSNL